jgi:hypothetical protein
MTASGAPASSYERLSIDRKERGARTFSLNRQGLAAFAIARLARIGAIAGDGDSPAYSDKNQFGLHREPNVAHIQVAQLLGYGERLI